MEHMTTVETSITVNVPIQAVYHQWIQFEEFPKFMDGVKKVTRLDDKRSHWKAQIVGKAREWEAEIIEQIPDERIVWRSHSGAVNEGIITFQRLSETRSRIIVQLRYMPDGVVEIVGDRWGAVLSRVQGDLEQFKAFVERQCETGAGHGWFNAV